MYSSADITEYESVDVAVDYNGAEFITLSAVKDGIALEYDDKFKLQFVHELPNFIEQIERLGEFIRHTVIVNIIDNDRK